MSSYTFYEFFAGGGMARAGLGQNWSCVFANDNDPHKKESYFENWGIDHFCSKSVTDLTSSELPDQVDLAWASFPCQDLSLAGNRKGLNAERSGTFWPFWNLMVKLDSEGRAPRIIVLENVEGALTSHGGKDFSAIASSLKNLNYKFGPLIIDAKHFVPQSRRRLFIIGISNNLTIPGSIVTNRPNVMWHPNSVNKAYSNLNEDVKKNWIWWNLPMPSQRSIELIDILEENPIGVDWNSSQYTKGLIKIMSKHNIEKLKKQCEKTGKVIGTLYRRTRNNLQRAEIRFDGIAGCLRTPAGGSSRQTIIVVDGDNIRTRLISPREAARLMGLSDEYKLPSNYNTAYHLLGDGLVVPVVTFLAKNIIEPVIKTNTNITNKEVA